MYLKKIVKKSFRFVIPSTSDEIKKLLVRELLAKETVLDLGCGLRSPLHNLKGDSRFSKLHSIGVDIFSPYLLENANNNPIHSEYVNKDIFEISYPDKSIDVTLMFDVIEHFEKDKFLEFLPKLEKMTKKIIIITPNGFVEQGEYDGNEHQKHLSGWTVAEMTNLGFKCYGLSGLKFIQDSGIRPIWLKIILCDISQIFLKRFPRQSFHIVAIKNI